MGLNSGVSWTDDSRGFWRGCTEIPGKIINRETGEREPSPCDNCYARREVDERYHIAKWGKGQERLKADINNVLRDMRKFDRLGAQGFPRLVFINPQADIFDEEVPDSWRDEAIFQGIAPFPNVMALLLTKRSSKMLRYVKERARSLPHNLSFGVTAGTQTEADERLPALVELRRFLPWSVVLYVSIEPLLGRVDIRPWLAPFDHREKYKIFIDGVARHTPDAFPVDRRFGPGFIDWALVGGESGPQSLVREMLEDDAAFVMNQLAETDTPPFFKQAGLLLGRRWGGTDSHGHQVECWPPKFRVQRFPPEFRRPEVVL